MYSGFINRLVIHIWCYMIAYVLITGKLLTGLSACFQQVFVDIVENNGVGERVVYLLLFACLNLVA